MKVIGSLVVLVLLMTGCSDLAPDASEVRVFRDIERLNEGVDGYQESGRDVIGFLVVEPPFDPVTDLVLPDGFAFSQEVDDPLSHGSGVLIYYSGPDPRRPEGRCSIELNGERGAGHFALSVSCVT